ncbi:aminotransferase class I and II [Clostridium sp. DL-VIII]|uniref:pyridoxal phosphate-dependent aminotransferase n=1 Tax=Clostridium sp. DL-VIII TaxID=641107 RepID=UPI00023B03A5|nr:aminotransferase class I/II-fold pyridoxal phosphate-dependent enzyme [Clostridium sp. DL-VIII]EHJ01835.1 aminotransferase class I and II [Clostridium sp. DL-VIII]
MLSLSDKVEKFSESMIRQMTILANKYGAINLAQGFPEFDPSSKLILALEKAAKEGPHQYAPSWGAENFRQAIADKQSLSFGRRIDSNTEVLVTCGSTEAMISVMLTVFNPGDKVIIFSPYYTSYVADAILAQAEPIFVSLKAPNFNFEESELEEAFKQSPKAIILCNPSNPSGKVFTQKELIIIGNLAEKYNAFVITDEVYEHIVYKPFKQVYFASLPGMFESTISCSSLSKTYSITGWRLGYVIAPKKIIENVRKIHDFLTVAAPSPLQEAAITGLNFNDGYYDELQEVYTKKRDYFLKGLDEIGLKHTNPEGTYFVLVDISEFEYESDIEFCKFLVKEYGIAAVPGSSFFHEGGNNWVRMHFAKNNETLSEALRRLRNLKKSIERRVKYD